MLYLDLALEAVVRSAAERGTGAAGRGASSLVGPLLQNLVLSTGDNEELCYCLKAWQDLPGPARGGQYPSKEVALKVRGCLHRLSDPADPCSSSNALSSRLRSQPCTCDSTTGLSSLHGMFQLPVAESSAAGWGACQTLAATADGRQWGLCRTLQDLHRGYLECLETMQRTARVLCSTRPLRWEHICFPMNPLL